LREALALLQSTDAYGARLERPIKTRDGRFVDSTGAFLVGELERLDQTLHEPLASITWERDLPMRTDVTVADEVSSFTQSTFATPSGTGNNAIGQKRSVITQNTTQVPEIEIDINKVTLPLIPWGEGVRYTMHELASAAQLGRPVDQQKVVALNRDYQLQMDAQAYLGWQGNNTVGLVNATVANGGQVTVTNFPNGASGFPQWAKKTASEILTDLANLIFTPWAASGFAVKPNQIRLDSNNYSLISTQPATLAGSKSILQYFLESNIAANAKQPLEVIDLKWLNGGGVGGTLGNGGTVNRAVAYHKYEGGWQDAYVRFPLVMLQRTPIQFDGLFHKFYYWGRMGACEFVYPETVAYFDGN
jgi:hypothetical protein